MSPTTTTPPVIRLRPDQFEARLRRKRVGTTDAAIAKAIGLDMSTVYRVRVGERPPSGRFVAHALAALGCKFEHLFEVT